MVSGNIVSLLSLICKSLPVPMLFFASPLCSYFTPKASVNTTLISESRKFEKPLQFYMAKAWLIFRKTTHIVIIL